MPNTPTTTAFFEAQLSGGHPNSLGNTVAVVQTVLQEPKKFDALFQCYFSNNEIVRLRVSNAMKRIAKENKSLLIPYIDKLLTQIANIDQASTQWTLAQLFDTLHKELSPQQKEQAQAIMQRNLAQHQDWIVLNQTMNTLGKWAKKNADLKSWLTLHLERLAADERKSVSKTAQKQQQALGL